jgi:hypothetical protein
MGDIDGRWYPSSSRSIYHGRADGDGGSVWVYPRVHSRAGLFVEVHQHAPDGPLLRRTAASHETEAAATVDALRTAMVRRGVDAVKGEVEPLVTRGCLLVHGAAQRGKHAADVVAVDGGPEIWLCIWIWVPLGTHHLTAARGSTIGSGPLAGLIRRATLTEADVTIEDPSTVELFISTFRHRVRTGHPRFHWPCRLHIASNPSLSHRSP